MIGTSARPSFNDLPPWLAFGMFAVCWLTLLGGMPGALSPTNLPWARYLRGPDMGGGVGGLLGTLRHPVNSYERPVSPTASNPVTERVNLSNGRGDIVAQSDVAGALTWTASYEAYGKRTLELGSNEDRQRANTKEEDPTGLLNEGFRYRDIETGVWLSRDPAGFVDGPNLYAYVRQNPWTSFDPHGLATKSQLHKQRRQLIKRRDAEKSIREKNGEKLIETVGVGADSGEVPTEYGRVMQAFDSATGSLDARIRAIDKAVDLHNGVVDAMGAVTGGAHPGHRISRIQFDDEDPKYQVYLRNGARAQSLKNEIAIMLISGAAGKALQVGGKTLRLLSPAARGTPKLDNAANAVEDFLGGPGKIIKNSDGDTILMRGDKKIRFDIKDPHGDKPHFHLEKQNPSGKWKDAGPEHRYYFKEVGQ